MKHYDAKIMKLNILHYCGKRESEENNNPPSHYGLLWPVPNNSPDAAFKLHTQRKTFKLEEVPDDNHCWTECVFRWAKGLQLRLDIVTD